MLLHVASVRRAQRAPCPLSACMPPLCPAAPLTLPRRPAPPHAPPAPPTQQNMLKGMDPEALAGMMQQSGMNVTPEQARSIVDKLDSVSGAAPLLCGRTVCAL